MTRPLSVALIQMDAREDVETNISDAGKLTNEAAARGARFIALPEYLQYRGPDLGYRASSQPIPGPHTEPFAHVARRYGCWILLGSLAETAEDGRCYNTSVLLAPDGSVAATYRKIHLFDIEVDAGPHDRESARVAPGDRAVTAEVEGVTFGLTVCYDLRFPDLYRTLALRGASVITVPSAFTERTGRDHWEVLLRARAIENGAWILAPAQIGGPPAHRAYGRSMIVDPWGTVVAQAPDTVGIVRAEIDPSRSAAIRRQIPSLAHRRPSAYDPG